MPEDKSQVNNQVGLNSIFGGSGDNKETLAVSSPMPPNPYFAFVELTIGEFNMTLLPPEHLISFTYNRKPLNAANKFTISLFDETAIMLEYQLIQGYKDIKFQYGYVGGVKSPVYSGQVTSYDIDFTTAGATLNIEGISSSTSAFSKPRTKSYENMRIDEIVRDIAQEENWEVGKLVECQPVSDGDNPNKTFVRSNLTAPVFITQELIPLAKAASNGDSNFVLNFDDSGDKTIVNFYPIIQASVTGSDQVKEDKSSNDKDSVKRDYEFQWGGGDRNSRVISFNPNYSGILKLVSGGATVDAKAVDRIANEMFHMSIDNTTDEAHTVLDEKSAYDFSTAKRVIGGSSYTQDEMKHISAYLWYTNASYPVTADMSILGDPNIQAFDLISMVMLNKDGIPHHSSGAYLIKEIEDQIEGGNFVTNMQLFRNAMHIGFNEAGGLNITMDSTYPTTSITGGDASIPRGSSSVSDSRIVQIALNEIGNYGGEKFWTWAGFSSRDSWCAMFVSWCADQAGLTPPKEYNCDNLRMYFINKGTWHGRSTEPNYKPNPGDCIIFGDDSAEGTHHTGLVVRADENNIYTVEGNTTDQVAERTYSFNHSDIAGFGVL